MLSRATLLRSTDAMTTMLATSRQPLGSVDSNCIDGVHSSPARKRVSASNPRTEPGLNLELRDDASCDSSLVDISINAVDTPTLDAGAWTPSADVGAALVAKAQSKLQQQCGAWTPSATLGTDAVARAEARLDQKSNVLVSPATQHIKAIGSEDEDLSRALRNFRAKRSQTERSISWASRLPLSASISNVLSELELAFSTMRVWKIVDADGETHLVSLRHFSQSSEMHIDGSLVATAAHPIWSKANSSLELPFETNGVVGTIKMGKDHVYECIVDGETMPEDAQSLPPSSRIVHISVPRYEIRESADGHQYAAFEIHSFTRADAADEDAPCERVEAFKRFSQFQTLQAQLGSVQRDGVQPTALPVRQTHIRFAYWFCNVAHTRSVLTHIMRRFYPQKPTCDALVTIFWKSGEPSWNAFFRCSSRRMVSAITLTSCLSWDFCSATTIQGHPQCAGRVVELSEWSRRKNSFNFVSHDYIAGTTCDHTRPASICLTGSPSSSLACVHTEQDVAAATPARYVHHVARLRERVGNILARLNLS